MRENTAMDALLAQVCVSVGSLSVSGCMIFQERKANERLSQQYASEKDMRELVEKQLEGERASRVLLEEENNQLQVLERALAQERQEHSREIQERQRLEQATQG